LWCALIVKIPSSFLKCILRLWRDRSHGLETLLVFVSTFLAIQRTSTSSSVLLPPSEMSTTATRPAQASTGTSTVTHYMQYTECLSSYYLKVPYGAEPNLHHDLVQHGGTLVGLTFWRQEASQLHETIIQDTHANQIILPPIGPIANPFDPSHDQLIYPDLVRGQTQASTASNIAELITSNIQRALSAALDAAATGKTIPPTPPTGSVSSSDSITVILLIYYFHSGHHGDGDQNVKPEGDHQDQPH